MTRFALAALAAILITGQAEARALHGRYKALATPAIDLAAKPAYPTADMPGRQPRVAANGALDANGTPAHRREVREASPRASNGEIGSGIVRSAKTGATARVSPTYTARFQAYVDDLEAQGAKVLFMGGYRKGRCWTGGRHPCGMALDVCQLRRGVVDRRCNLPGPAAIFSIAARHDLFEGGGWRNSDYGHAQAGGNDAAAVRFDGSSAYASARSHPHHRRVRFAVRR